MSFKFCLVGCGAMANSRHGPSGKRYESLNEGAEFAACCDVVAEKAVSFKEQFGIPRYYTDIDAMLDAEKPDAVCLVAPVEKTVELSCNILNKGYPLIMEKPPGQTAAETKKMIDAAAKNNVPNQVAFNRRYMPLVRRFKKIFEGFGKEERITDIQYRMLRVGRNDPDFSTTAIHGVDLVRFIAGADYKEIAFRYQPRKDWGENVADIHMDCEMASGAFAHLDFLPVSGMTVERLEINTTKGLFYLKLPMLNNVDYEGVLVHYVKNREALVVGGFEAAGCKEDYVLGGFYDENARFFDDIRNGAFPAGDLVSGLQSVEASYCIKERLTTYNKN